MKKLFISNIAYAGVCENGDFLMGIFLEWWIKLLLPMVAVIIQM